MKNIGKIIGINLAILLVYSVVIRIVNGGGGSGNKGLGILIVSAGVISLHVFVNLIIMVTYYAKNNSLGNTWLLSSGVVLLVGFSTCLGNATW